MIIQLIVFVLLVVLGGFLYYPSYYLVDQVFQVAADQVPNYVNATAYPQVAFIQAMNYWWLLLVVLLPALVWFFVNVQGPSRYE